MNSTDDQQFLKQVFQKSGIPLCIIPRSAANDKLLSDFLDPLFGLFPSSNIPVKELIGDPQPQSMYKLRDSFGLNYLYFIMADKEDKILFVGPYVEKPLTVEDVLESNEQNNITTDNKEFIESYCSSIPVLSPTSHLFIMLDTFFEMTWKCDTFPLVELVKGRDEGTRIIEESRNHGEINTPLIHTKIIENRYKTENELISAISHGQLQKINQLLSVISTSSFENRVPDKVRNFKNYGIIMNTLLRKAAEQGGVHPVHLDRTSSMFAKRIEQMSDYKEAANIIRDMPSAYCKLVRKHSLKGYSPLIQKTILYIESDLSAELTLAKLASSQEVSAGYLSTLFRKETGKTLTEFITEKRINYASHLLSTTNLQIQTIALNCGIVDVQYFSKTFKRYTGISPKEYRKQQQ